MQRRKYERDELIEWLQRIKTQQRGRGDPYGPSKAQIRRAKFPQWEEKPLYREFVREFGDYETMIKEAGFQLPPEECDPQHSVELELDKITTRTEYAFQKPGFRPEKLPLAQQKTETEPLVEEQPSSRGRRCRWTDEELGIALQQAWKELRHDWPPTTVRYTAWAESTRFDDERLMPTPTTLIKRCGGGRWSGVVRHIEEQCGDEDVCVSDNEKSEVEEVLEEMQVTEEAAKDPMQKMLEMINERPKNTPYEKEWLIKFLCLLHDHLERTPRTSDLRDIEGAPTRKVFARCFGGWVEALLAAEIIAADEAEEMIRRRGSIYAWRDRDKEPEEQRGGAMDDSVKVALEPVVDSGPTTDVAAEVVAAPGVEMRTFDLDLGGLSLTIKSDTAISLSVTTSDQLEVAEVTIRRK